MPRRAPSPQQAAVPLRLGPLSVQGPIGRGRLRAADAGEVVGGGAGRGVREGSRARLLALCSGGGSGGDKAGKTREG